MPKLSKCIGIVGSRRRDAPSDFKKCLKMFEEIFSDGDSIVSGGCYEGGDRFAEIIAKSKGLTITIHYPDWKREGKFAGFIRNTKIAEQCDILLALVAKDRTGGTEDAVRKCNKLGKRIIYA